MYYDPNIYTGCDIRAHHFSLKITELVRLYATAQFGSEKPFDYPFKHFMSGSLVVQYDGKKISWAAHVAPIIKLKDGEFYILDPGVSNKPLTKEAYHNKWTTLDGYVTCQHDAYNFAADCFNPENIPSSELYWNTQDWLNM